ncbi:hypothetical protein [Mycolicibacterium fortuitum]|uniref:hypothetical protein n=1 Tax=Mycolicibacterium fortuitum TaxID=1766 RepID=UPI001CE110F1|nr:hypothetical protein [Mycolicibacterium fortuitum]MCA4727328.1 hypothetical protein [Mycolicibacterium fortuitum]
MTGGGGFLTPLGAAASGERVDAGRSVRASSYDTLLTAAGTREQQREVRELVARASGRKERTLRGWRREGVPAGGAEAVGRAAAVWRLGGIERAAEAFGLSVRRTLSWLEGRGRRNRVEQQRIRDAVEQVSAPAALRVRVRFDAVSIPLDEQSKASPRSERDREVETTLPDPTSVMPVQLSESDVETLDELVRAGDTVAALSILEPLLFENYMLEMVDMNLTEILMPRLRAGVKYVLTPAGVIGPGYGE